MLVVTRDRCASDTVYDSSKYLSTFIVGMVLSAFGSVPLYVLGVTYIDDASPHGTASVHMGIYNYFCMYLQRGQKNAGPVHIFYCAAAMQARS